MDVKFTKKLIWFGERTIRNHPTDTRLIEIVSIQNARMSDQLKEYLAQNPGKNVKFDPKVDVPYYDRLVARDKK